MAPQRGGVCSTRGDAPYLRLHTTCRQRLKTCKQRLRACKYRLKTCNKRVIVGRERFDHSYRRSLRADVPGLTVLRASRRLDPKPCEHLAREKRANATGGQSLKRVEVGPPAANGSRMRVQETAGRPCKERAKSRCA